jgi:hypothetical protein
MWKMRGHLQQIGRVPQIPHVRFVGRTSSMLGWSSESFLVDLLLVASFEPSNA